MGKKPNVLFIMTDQQRADTIASLGNSHIHTPNLDRLARRGISFSKAYSNCPVCVPARYVIRTGREPSTIGIYSNSAPQLRESQPEKMEDRCGPYLARSMKKMGYRTFGIGKFHSSPWNEDLGYDVHIHSEEMYGSQKQREMDGFASFIAKEHPEFDYVETLMGERTEMYYMPQMSPQPAESTVESWAADRAVEQIKKDDEQPYFGLVSFIGPHPPLAPPLPFNRMYDPDRMPNPEKGTKEIDEMDEQIGWMNHAVFAEEINNPHARMLKSRYYGEISFIDQCLGKILDAVDASEDPDNTVICFFADHGDHMGDHGGWQKESFFDASCRIPFLVSWPNKLPSETISQELVSLVDLFGIATEAAGAPETRDGINVFKMLEGGEAPREYLSGLYEAPGSRLFKIMVRDKDWKYIFMANGGREQLFNMTQDPNEKQQLINENPEVAKLMRDRAVSILKESGLQKALDGDSLKKFPFSPRKLQRIYQFDSSRGVTGFPEKPEDALASL